MYLCNSIWWIQVDLYFQTNLNADGGGIYFMLISFLNKACNSFFRLVVNAGLSSERLNTTVTLREEESMFTFGTQV